MQVIQLRAIQDSIPEREEMFRIELLQPEGAGELGMVITRYVYVAENDAPHGLIEIHPTKTRY